MTDPLGDIENAKAQRDLGVLAVRVYQGAREEAGSWREAFWATVALLLAMVMKPDGPEEEDAEGAEES